jgi:isoleucyl-tRNA synthetase
LWVEVEVEKELGFKSKKDIEVFGVDKFVDLCRERVLKYSTIQTEQSKRLGYFMDWENSYFTMSEENNYMIWHFLEVCFQKGWIYKGHESVPWCPRCETAISQHEMLTEDYKELTHESIYLKLPLVDGNDKEYLLIWTTTPWTIPANIAVAVDKNKSYTKYPLSGENKEFVWVMSEAVERLVKAGVLEETSAVVEKAMGASLVGKKYTSPFDQLPAVSEVISHPNFHVVIPTDDQIMPISGEEGTGLVHTAVSAGTEDFQLGKKLGLPMIPIIADNADYLSTMGEFAGQNAKKHPEIIIDFLKNTEGGRYLLKTVRYTHRYPACWRCKTELVWKIADECRSGRCQRSHSEAKDDRCGQKDFLETRIWLRS